MSPNDYSGTCELTRISGAEERLIIGRADPRVKITGDLIREAEHAQPGLNRPPYAELDGDLFRINGDNRTVVYRLVEYVKGEDVFLAEWPD